MSRHKITGHELRTVLKRLDDLRNADIKFFTTEVHRIDETKRLNFEHQKELRELEFKRLDANFDSVKLMIAQSQETSTNQLDRLITRMSALELAQSQNTGKSSIWTNPILLIMISALVGFIVAKYLR